MNDRIDFDEYSTQYTDLLRQDTSFFSKNDAYFAWYKIERMKKYLSRPVNRILEIGCGVGRNIPFLRNAFPKAKIVGTDISRQSLQIAIQHNPGVAFLCEKDLQGDIGTFDLILVAGVYHHVPLRKRLALTRLLYRRLALQGDLFVFEQNPYNPLTRRIVSRCVYDKDAVLVYPHQLRHYLVTEGFLCTNTQYCLFFPPFFKIPGWIEAKLSWLPMGGQYYLRVKK